MIVALAGTPSGDRLVALRPLLDLSILRDDPNVPYVRYRFGVRSNVSELFRVRLVECVDNLC